jgi:hypothetical protein
MITLDRRALVIGLAAVAAAGGAPALPADCAEAQIATGEGAALFCSSVCFYRKPGLSRESTTAASRWALISRWLVDVRGNDDATYFHVESGLHFAAYPESPGTFWWMHPAHEPAPPLVHYLTDAGHALVFAHDNFFELARRQRGRGGCFAVEYREPDYLELVTEDAPPLPRVAAFDDDSA